MFTDPLVNNSPEKSCPAGQTKVEEFEDKGKLWLWLGVERVTILEILKGDLREDKIKKTRK